MPAYVSKETLINELGVQAGDIRARVTMTANVIKMQYDVPHELILQLVQESMSLGRMMNALDSITPILMNVDKDDTILDTRK